MGRIGTLLAVTALTLPLSGCPGLLEPYAAPQHGGPSMAEVQATPYYGPKARIAVLDFGYRAAKGHEHVGTGLSEMLVTELVRSGRFIVLERRALAQVMGEQDLGASGRVENGTEAPIGQIEGAELLVTGIVSEFEPDYQGQSIVLATRKYPVALALNLRHAHLAIDLRIIDARTSRILAATSVEGRATDFGGGIIGRVGGGSSQMGIGLGGYRNTPMEQAIRKCLAVAASYVASQTPQQYYHYDGAGRPVLGDTAPPRPPVVETPPAPAVLPAPAELPGKARVILGRVRAYELPDAASRMVATVVRGTELAVLGQDGDWYAVRLGDGVTAWLLKAFTEPIVE